MNTYQQLADLVLPLMSAYQTDVTTHDKKAIEDGAGVAFVHVTRETSTHIYMAPDHDWLTANIIQPHLFGRCTPRCIIEQALGMMVEYFKDDDVFHYYDGANQVRKITRQTAINAHRAWLEI